MDGIAYKLRNYPTLEDTSNNFPNNVYIFGHSLDITDKDVIKKFIDREDVKTTIFYYDKQQQTQQIANLVKILEQEKFENMINSVPQKICFVYQLQKNKNLYTNRTHHHIKNPYKDHNYKLCRDLTSL
ncbi:MAG: hypothetical protein K2J91_03645 [Lachnospiraceae bacterium]|nr:hypothetical protein [Lachnospiraceae bacterium]